MASAKTPEVDRHEAQTGGRLARTSEPCPRQMRSAGLSNAVARVGSSNILLFIRRHCALSASRRIPSSPSSRSIGLMFEDARRCCGGAELLMSMIRPIGAGHSGLISAYVGLPHTTLANAIATWRRRACAIALGRCGHSAMLDSVTFGDHRIRWRRLESFADYVELRSLRSAARSADIRLGDADEAEQSHPARLWPFHYPTIEPAATSDSAQDADQRSELGAYLDVIF